MRASNQWLINLSKDELLWATELDEVPSMIHFEYVQLKNLAREGQVYGVLLQCKDTFEMLLKIPVIMALVIIDSNPKYKDGPEYAEIMNGLLKSPLSMGNWRSLADIIVGKNKKLQLPEKLIEILERTRKLYREDITDDYSDVVKWRNEEIGHGALKFQDDPSYQEEVNSLLLLLKEYFIGAEKFSIKGFYGACYFQCGGKKLVGSQYLCDIDNSSMTLHIDEQSFPISNYISDRDLKWYLFDSFYSHKDIVKYSSYIDGKNNSINNIYFSNLFKKYVLQGSNDASINSDYRTREEEELLERLLHTPPDYVEQTKIVELLKKKMQEIEKGTITLFMERGTGKSAFANQMSGLYHSKSLIKNSFSRCYHISNASLRGLSDFVGSIEYEYTHSFDSSKDIRGGTKMLPSVSLETENPAEDMAKALNTYHDIYQKKYTVLVIDGIDEITEQTKGILDFIPSRDQLNEGVFIILTTRFADEDSVKGKSKKYIEKAVKLSDTPPLEIRRYDEINVELLNRYIIDNSKKVFKLEQNIDKNALIIKSDYRFLYLRAYLGISDRVDLDNTNESNFIKSYMNYILSFYGIKQKQILKEIAVSIALFPSITIDKYQKYLNCQEVTYEFIGLFSDLLPLLTVVRLGDENVYEFADSAYADSVIDEYPDVVKDVILYFNESLNDSLKLYLIYGGALRDFQLGFSIANEENLNSSIIFYLESLLGLWNEGIKHPVISELFFKYLDITKLLSQLVVDNWANYGYALYLRKELLSCITEGLFLGLKSKSDACVAWTKRINNMFKRIESDSYFEQFAVESLKNTLTCHKAFCKIKECLLNNYKDVKCFEDWFWVFESRVFATELSPEIIETIKYHNCEDNYADYMLQYSSHYKYANIIRIRLNLECVWAEEVLQTKISQETEEKLLNYLLEQYLTMDSANRNGKQCKDLAREYYDLIKQKKYKIIINRQNQELFQKLQEETFVKKQFMKTIYETIHALSGFTQLTVYDYNNIRKIYSHLDSSELINAKNSFLPDAMLTEFHLAFYKRMCYEYDKGHLEIFLENTVFTDAKRLGIVFKSVFGDNNNYVTALLEWVDALLPTASSTKKFIYSLASHMMVLSIQKLEEMGNESEALSVLERLVYEIDTNSFFASIMKKLHKKLEPDMIYHTPGLVYCTDNALYLLQRFCEKKDTVKANKLIKTMEESVLDIEKSMGICSDTMAISDIQKYRFLALKYMFGLEDEFNKYLEAYMEEHIKGIQDFINHISRQYDFRVIAKHVEMFLEFAWQNRMWQYGETCCKELLEILASVNCNSDNLLEESVKREMEKIRECRKFFAFLNGKEVESTDNNIYFESSYSIWLPVQSLYRSVNFLKCIKNPGEEDRKRYRNMTEIKLRCY